MKKISRSNPLILVRYIYPLVSYIAFAVLALIPCVKFTLDSDTRESMSIFQLIDNSWGSARQYLFSEQISQTNDGTLFYKLIFFSLIISFLLFIIALAVDIFSAAVYSIYVRSSGNDVCKPQILYQTLIPNRIVLSIIRLLSLPILFFPSLVEYLYQKILIYPVNVSGSAKLPALIATAILLIGFILTAVSKRYEILHERNVFSNKTAKSSNEENTYKDITDKESEAKVYHINGDTQKSSEKIRRIFNDDDDSK